jgi:hypothetical protein
MDLHQEIDQLEQRLKQLKKLRGRPKREVKNASLDTIVSEKRGDSLYSRSSKRVR